VGLVLKSFRQVDKAVEQFLDPQTFSRYRTNVAAIDNRGVFEVVDLAQQILATHYPTKVSAVGQT